MINILIVFAVGVVLLLIAAITAYIGNNRFDSIGMLCDFAAWLTVVPGAVIAIVALACFVIKMLLGTF